MSVPLQRQTKKLLTKAKTKTKLKSKLQKLSIMKKFNSFLAIAKSVMASAFRTIHSSVANMHKQQKNAGFDNIGTYSSLAHYYFPVSRYAFI